MNNLEKMIEKNKKKVLDIWFESVLNSYPKDKNRFLATKNDQFLNPIGSNIKGSLKDVLEELLKKNPDLDSLEKFLDPVIRIAAVQEFKASSATAFIFSLKEILRVEFQGEVKAFHKELDAFSSKVDMLALIAFEIYTGCREKIFELKARHVNERTLNILKAKDVFVEIPEVGTDIISHEIYKKSGF